MMGEAHNNFLHNGKMVSKLFFVLTNDHHFNIILSVDTNTTFVAESGQLIISQKWSLNPVGIGLDIESL